MNMVTVAGFVLTVAGLLGIAYAVFRSNLQRTTLSLYREDNEALRGRVDTLENERDALREKIETLIGTVAALREERATLRDLATGATAVANLEAALNRRLDELEDLIRLHVNDRRHRDEESDRGA